MRHGDYGYDAPYALLGFIAATVIAALLAASTWRESGFGPAAPMMISCLVFFVNAASFWYATRHGKFQEWERILDGLSLRGDESALDMGCGRGAVLTAVARRLPGGQVTGIDIWSKADQSGNAETVTLRNAALEGVGERVQIRTADMRSLPFADGSFDLIVSSLAIHNISSDNDRKQAISEGFRVLKPGGRMAIADIRAAAVYVEALQPLGALHVERRRLGWRFWWGNPLAATSLVTGTKPE
jgi:SAM-dependent methyltransferase